MPMRLSELFSPAGGLTAEVLHRFLSDSGTRPVRLTVTRNRVSLLSICSPGSGPVRLRLHERFLGAPASVLQALKAYLQSRRRSDWQTVTRFAGTIPGQRSAGSALKPVQTRGCEYDLEAIGDMVNQRFFGGRLTCRIGWGRRHSPVRRRSIRFGVYLRERNLVLVNSRLDDRRVPPEFIDYVVFHEMLHAAVPPLAGGRRWIHHSPEFKKRERVFPNLPRLRRMGRQLFLGRQADSDLHG